MNRFLKIGVTAALTAGMGAVVIGSVSANSCDFPVSVSDMTPTSGFAGGGTKVEITGANFATCGVSRVSFGDADGTDFGRTDETTITVVTPAGAGVVVPALHYGSESAVAPSFTYVPVPVLDRMLPPRGPSAGGTKVIIWGTDLEVADATTEVMFGDVAVEPDVVSDTQLIVQSPAHDPGTVDVVVLMTLASGETATSASAPFTFVPPPSVTGIDDASGSAAGGDVVEISGTDFQRGARVLMGKSDGSVSPEPGASRFGSNRAALVVEFVDDTTLLAITPAGTPGDASVVVINPDGQFGALTDGYTYSGAFPTLTSVTPGSGPSLGGTEITIVGTGFVAGATVELGSGDDRSRARSVSVTPTQIVATTPSHPPATGVAVTVTNPDGGSSSMASAFRYEASAAPTITSIDPITGGSLGGATLTILGTGFASGAVVRFGDVAIDGVEVAAAVLDSGRINVTTPAHPAGAVEVRLVNPDGQFSTATTFTFTAAPSPTIISVTPAAGPTAGGTLVTVAGTGFAAGAEVTVGGVSVTSEFDAQQGFLPIVRDATTIVGITPAGQAGATDVTVRNPDGATAATAGGFTFAGPPPAEIASIAPSSGSSLGGLVVDLTGTDFAEGSIVTFGNADCSEAQDIACNVRAPADSTTRLGATSIRTTTPTGLYGFVDVTVIGPDGTTTTLPYGFEFVDASPPGIDAVVPEVAATGDPITISGDGYAPAAQAYIGTRRVTSVIEEVVDVTDPDNTITRILPTVRDTSTIVGLVPRSSGGAFLVAVANPDGQGVILTDAFSYPVDTTPPTTTASAATGTPLAAHTFGAANWARGPVSVTLVAIDDPGGSGVDTITYSATGAQTIFSTVVSGSGASFTVSAQGLSTVAYAATDIAGNVETSSTRVVAIDSVPPAITGTSTFVPGTQTNQDVDVVFECADTDGGSGVTLPISVSSTSTTTTDGTNPLTVTVTFTEPGLGQSVTATCEDVAGNVSTTTFGGINITRTGPTLTAVATTADGLAYTPGVWTNLNVVVTFVCRPSLAVAPLSSPQVASVTPPQFVTTGVTDHSVDGECTDTAGNVATATFDGIHVDKTLPVMTASASSGRIEYTAGQWTNAPVVVTFTCSDDGPNQSGDVTFSDPITVGEEGTTAGVTGTCTDDAGNRANPAVFLGPILIDTTPPTCSVVVTPNPLRPANNRFVSVVASVRTADSLSGVERYTLESITSNRQNSSDIVGFVPGTASTTGSLRAARGNVYTFTYVAYDRAGNGSDPCTVQVGVG